jgi:ABC-type glycerol-3-phosphate transport system substrate-binding protein
VLALGGVQVGLGPGLALANNPIYTPYPFPRGPRGRFAPVTATVGTVTTGSTNPEAAIEYVRYLLSPEAQIFLARTGLRPVTADPRAVSAWQERVGDQRARAIDAGLAGGYVNQAPSFGPVVTGLGPFLTGSAQLDPTVSALIAAMRQ